MSKIPKAHDLLGVAAAVLGHPPISGPEPFTTRALWIIHVAASKLALRCADEDGDREAVEREGDRLYRLLSAAAGTEEIIAEARAAKAEKLQ